MHCFVCFVNVWFVAVVRLCDCVRVCTRDRMQFAIIKNYLMAICAI